jgi:hypothetical protein
MSELIRVANLCEKAAAPDRMLDLEILRAVTGKHWLWCAGGKFVTWPKYGGDAPGNPICSLEEYTASIDEAVTLVPEGWFWRVGRTSIYQAWAGVHQTHPDHGEKDKNEFFFRRELWEPPSTPALALCNVALRAKASLSPADRGKS